ncbi:MAG: hypothetical protein KAH32_04575, partial [Chlamydiia bacterium]|nr:hypothetical protein [Chlamydiia bacterium]
MPKYRNFSLGVNNANPSDQIDDSELSVAENVEYNGSANPEKREGLKASELNDALDFLVGISGDVTKFIAWSPKIMPNVSYGSYVYIIFTTVYEVHVIYKLNEKSWVSYQIEIEDIIYTSASSSVISFTKAVDRIVITDGVNKAHFFKIDRDGILVDGIMEYPAPKYIPKIEVMAEYIDENFETNIEESKLGECGLYVYCWCYADKWLNLSNPSPVSDPIDRQFFSFDEDGDPDKWVESFRITNMKIPEIDEDTKRNIKFIYLFRKYYKHTEDLTNMDWDLYSVYEIPNVEAFNEILDFNDTGEGQALDYGNAAPVASGALAQGNSIFLAGCKTKDTFLWEFEWAFPISINNQNNNIKVNKVYRVRITEAMMGRRNGEEEYPFKLNEFFTSLDRMRKLCFFAQDKTTPIKSMLITTSSTRAGREVYFDASIQIPNLNPGFNIIYFNFTTLDNDAEFEGIPQEFIDLEDKYSYGRMFVPYDIGSVIGADDWTKQTMFTT